MADSTSIISTDMGIYRMGTNRGEWQDGGWGGIRTHGTLAGTPVFKTGALNRSATHP